MMSVGDEGRRKESGKGHLPQKNDIPEGFYRDFHPEGKRRRGGAHRFGRDEILSSWSASVSSGRPPVGEGREKVKWKGRKNLCVKWKDGPDDGL